LADLEVILEIIESGSKKIITNMTWQIAGKLRS
jgi:hypothetical protein